jgi:hypothetical protein
LRSRGRPCPPDAAPSGGLLLSNQDRASDVLACRGARKQVGVGRAGAVDDVQSAPQQARAREPVTKGHHIKRRKHIVGSHHQRLCQSIGRRSAAILTGRRSGR